MQKAPPICICWKNWNQTRFLCTDPCPLLDFGGEMQVPRLRTFFLFRNSFFPSSHSAALFHSTPTFLTKWKSKWSSDAGKSELPSKNYIRYASRQKRADAKKALKDVLFKTTLSKPSFQDEDWYADDLSSKHPQHEHDPHDFSKSSQAKESDAKDKSSSYRARASQNRKNKRKPKKQNFVDDYDGPAETIFQSTFGSRSFTWTFESRGDPNYEKSTWSFQWKNDPKPKHNRKIFWRDVDTDDEPSVIGSSSDRRTLGLPSTGPLKMEDVKSAFRASALKWHPDKHQRPSQVMAEEKFKLCVCAYKSLCNALSTT